MYFYRIFDKFGCPVDDVEHVPLPTEYIKKELLDEGMYNKLFDARIALDSSQSMSR